MRGSSREALRAVTVLVEAVLLQEREVVALIEDLDLGVGIELAETADLAILLRHELLVHRRDFDVRLELREVEVGGELLDDLALLVPLDIERTRLVFPLDLIEVEKPCVLPLAFVSEVDAVALESRSPGRDACPAASLAAALSRRALRL